jgi:uncharacterized iron-regulated membrane protein
VQLLAQMHAQHGADDGSLAITLAALVAMLIPWGVLAVVCWIFWRAKKREDEAIARVEQWRNAPSS